MIEGKPTLGDRLFFFLVDQTEDDGRPLNLKKIASKAITVPFAVLLIFAPVAIFELLFGFQVVRDISILHHWVPVLAIWAILATWLFTFGFCKQFEMRRLNEFAEEIERLERERGKLLSEIEVLSDDEDELADIDLVLSDQASQDINKK